MPLTAKGTKIMAAMKEQYGKRGEEVFYRSRNKGVIKGVEKRRHRQTPVKHSFMRS